MKNKQTTTDSQNVFDDRQTGKPGGSLTQQSTAPPSEAQNNATQNKNRRNSVTPNDSPQNSPEKENPAPETTGQTPPDTQTDEASIKSAQAERVRQTEKQIEQISKLPAEQQAAEYNRLTAELLNNLQKYDKTLTADTKETS